jgi:peptide/nickel transport system ATP-binding protein
MTRSDPLLAVRDLSVQFRPARDRRAVIRAVDSVSLEVRSGETLGVVGESGSGKSTLARAIVQIEQPTSGEVLLKGAPITRLRGTAQRRFRRHVQMVFQDPKGSLDPRQTVEQAISEPLEIHGIGTAPERRRRVTDLLERVGLDPRIRGRYSHMLSGGQQQRVSIARALSIEPDLLICDEPVSSLDVSIQAQIINLLRRLQRELGIGMIFIAHDLAVVRHVADRVVVMYLGKILEDRPSDELFALPLHPYTKALIDAVPVPDADVERGRRRLLLKGEIPSPASIPTGCRFRTRCPWARERCSTDVPELRVVPGHQGRVACHFAEELSVEPGADGQRP